MFNYVVLHSKSQFLALPLLSTAYSIPAMTYLFSKFF